MTIAAIIVAAGRGTRAGGAVPKQWRRLAGDTVCGHAIKAFEQHPAVRDIILVLHPDDRATDVWPKDRGVVAVDGGDSRSASVRAGLAAVPSGTTKVLIHDAARPLVSQSVIDRVVAALAEASAAAPALTVTDTLWRGETGTVTGIVDRDGLYAAQTPQGFDLKTLLSAYSPQSEATDDVTVARDAGQQVHIVPGDVNNLKITAPADFDRAARLMEPAMDVRLGNGYDVHRFGPGDHVWLCGVKVPHDHSLQGHSDADVGMHAVTDAIYGALGMGDIGQHFPPSDPQWKGAASHIFLEHAVTLARKEGFEISNVDCTLVCEYPKIGPHQSVMKAKLAEIMGMSAERISVKATTSERLGFTGRGEGIASLATVALIKT